MSYSPPTIGASGLVTPSFADILNDLIAAYRGIYGLTTYLGVDSADYQDISIRALQYSDLNGALIQVYGSLNPLTAIGPSLDLCGILIGTPRKFSTFSTALVTLVGTSGTVINNGVVQDTVGNFWNLPVSVTISLSGTVTVTATAQVLGNITANPGTIQIISTPTAGWNGVTNTVAAVPGVSNEPDSAYRARLMISQAQPSITTLAGTAAAIANLVGVTRSQVYENPTNTTDIVTGAPAHSITCVVEGGDATAIAQAIYNNRGIGCFTNGTTTISITDPNNGGISLPISFIILGYLPIYIQCSVHPLTGFSTAIQAEIQTALVNYLNAVGIGNLVLYGELFAAALSVTTPGAPTFAVRNISYGYGAQVTTGNVTIFSNLVTVADATNIAIGQKVVGNGLAQGTTVTHVSGTTITIAPNAIASGSGEALTFFTLVTAGTDIPCPFDEAALGATANVTVTAV